jgi:hypothetical protein
MSLETLFLTSIIISFIISIILIIYGISKEYKNYDN